VISDFDGNAYRAVYTVRFSNAVYTLHAFPKKSKRGIQTPRRDLALVRQRYKRAGQLHEQQSD
jgi:phage-related protein